MGLRFLLVIVAIIAILTIIRHQLRRASGNKDRRSSAFVQKMLRCKHCGVHVPQDEALTRNGNHYCCEAHAEADDRPDPDA